LGDVVREVKGRSLLGVRGVGRIRWQARFYDHVVRDFEDPTEIARYMVNNPVRAEMVEDWTQWPWIYVDPALVL
jgi:REP element-mobilizing transposase RayT